MPFSTIYPDIMTRMHVYYRTVRAAYPCFPDRYLAHIVSGFPIGQEENL
jgi:hypothetical protein